eukprot:4325569-Heterocapsa_arctica.AAC.1
MRLSSWQPWLQGLCVSGARLEGSARSGGGLVGIQAAALRSQLVMSWKRSPSSCGWGACSALNPLEVTWERRSV